MCNWESKKFFIPSCFFAKKKFYTGFPFLLDLTATLKSRTLHMSNTGAYYSVNNAEMVRSAM